jgi:hypothetical protein
VCCASTLVACALHLLHHQLLEQGCLAHPTMLLLLLLLLL